MISNLGKFAHPKKKASAMAKRPVSLTPQLGNQGAFPSPPKSKPDPVNRNVKDVSMTGTTPGTGAMPKGTIPSNNLATQGAGRGVAKKPAAKPGNKKTAIKRAKTMPFFGKGY